MKNCFAIAVLALITASAKVIDVDATVAKIIKSISNITTITTATTASSIYRNRLGECEPFTIDFIASLVTRKARQLLEPGSAPTHRLLRYDLYTRRNPNIRQLLIADDSDQLLQSHFNPSRPVRFSIHGWNGQTTTCSNAAIKDAYLEAGDFNVIIVDWSDYALDINYVRVIIEMFKIADQFNAFTRFLHDESGVAYSDMYLIAHSLGCHVAGIAGRRLQQPHKYGVIYALDAAGPVLSNLPAPWRLLPSDAMYVESIQTDLSFFGMRSHTLAHASFYPNWGLGQPHCPNASAMEPEFVCDHFSSLYYFVESLQNSKAFGAFRCQNFQSIEDQKCSCGQRKCMADAFMGGEPAVPKRGIYYLSTQPTKPFGFGEISHIRRALDPTTTRLQ